LAKKGSADNHDEMDSDRFEQWFRKQLLRNIELRTVIVMYNATYQGKNVETLPTTKS